MISNTHAFYPFMMWQLTLGMLGLVAGIAALKKYQSIGFIFIIHAVTLFLFWYTSRYFNNSHVAYIATLLIFGVLKLWDDEKMFSV